MNDYKGASFTLAELLGAVFGGLASGIILTLLCGCIFIFLRRSRKTEGCTSSEYQGLINAERPHLHSTSQLARSAQFSRGDGAAETDPFLNDGRPHASPTFTLTPSSATRESPPTTLIPGRVLPGSGSITTLVSSIVYSQPNRLPAVVPVVVPFILPPPARRPRSKLQWQSQGRGENARFNEVTEQQISSPVNHVQQRAGNFGLYDQEVRFTPAGNARSDKSVYVVPRTTGSSWAGSETLPGYRLLSPPPPPP